MGYAARRAGLRDAAQLHLVALADPEHAAPERVQPEGPGVGFALPDPYPGPQRRRVGAEQFHEIVVRDSEPLRVHGGEAKRAAPPPNPGIEGSVSSARTAMRKRPRPKASRAAAVASSSTSPAASSTTP